MENRQGLGAVEDFGLINIFILILGMGHGLGYKPDTQCGLVAS